MVFKIYNFFFSNLYIFIPDFVCHLKKLHLCFKKKKSRKKDDTTVSDFFFNVYKHFISSLLIYIMRIYL